MTGDQTTDDDELFAGKVRVLLDHAIANLTDAEREARLNWCAEYNQHGIVMHLDDADSFIEFRWGGAALAMIQRDVLTGDTPFQMESIRLPTFDD